jgi:RNA polymerase sigma-70 factor (ECF subfamily)
MGRCEPTDQFVRLVSDHQIRLYAWILSIVGSPADVRDVLQDVNVVIWQKAAEYVEGTDFWRWASQIAYFEVLTYRKRRGRDRLVFDDNLLASVAVEADRHTESIDADLVALRRCVEKLPPPDQDLVRERYSLGSSVKRLAELLGKSPGAVAQALYRIRVNLADCIEQEREHEQ